VCSSDLGEKRIARLLLNPNEPIQAKRQVIHNCLLSPILWSSPIWGADGKIIEIFEQKLRNNLKKAIRGPISTPILPLHAELGIPPIKFFVAKHTLLFLHRLYNSPNPISKKLAKLLIDKDESLSNTLLQAQYKSTECVRPTEFCATMSKKTLKAHVRRITNATLTDKLMNRSTYKTTDYGHHEAYSYLRKHRNIHETLDWFRPPKFLFQNLLRSSRHRRLRSCLLKPKDQITLIKARLGISATTQYKIDYGHLKKPEDWEHKCAACLHNIPEPGLNHLLTECIDTSHIRQASKLFPSFHDATIPTRAYLTMISDDTLNHKHKLLHISPAHMTAKLLQTSLHKITIRLSAHVHPNTYYARYKKQRKALPYRYSSTGLLD
jgi:hypothetical protein